MYPGEELEVNPLNCDPGDDGVKSIMIKNGSTILKEPRLFSFNCGKLSKEGIPHIEGKHSDKCLGILVKKNIVPWITSEHIINWVKYNPFSSQACYWFMDLLAGKQDWEKCSSEGKRFLFVTNSKHLEESATVSYKIACSDLMIGKIQESVEHLIFCLSINPSFAEGWCLLGDIFYIQNQLGRASSFYHNAILSGKTRNFHDLMLIMAEKYEEYPKNMIMEIGY